MSHMKASYNGSPLNANFAALQAQNLRQSNESSQPLKGSGQFKFVSIDENGIVRELSSQSSISSQEENKKDEKDNSKEIARRRLQSLLGGQLAQSVRLGDYKLTSSTKSENEEDNKFILDKQIELMLSQAKSAIKRNPQIEESLVHLSQDERNS